MVCFFSENFNGKVCSFQPKKVSDIAKNGNDTTFGPSGLNFDEEKSPNRRNAAPKFTLAMYK